MKTSVEWLQEQLECFGNKHELQVSWATVDELVEQAKEMHKQEIMNAFDRGRFWNMSWDGESYYEEVIIKGNND
jgi:hypothetical protein